MRRVALADYRMSRIKRVDAHSALNDETARDLYQRMIRVRERELSYLLTFVSKRITGKTNQMVIPMRAAEKRIAKEARENLKGKSDADLRTVIGAVMLLFREEVKKDFKAQGLKLNKTNNVFGPQTVVTPDAPELRPQNSIGAAWAQKRVLTQRMRPSPVITTMLSNLKTRQAVSDTMQVIKNQINKGESVISIPNSPLRDGVNPALYKKMLTDALENIGMEVKDVTPHHVGAKIATLRAPAPTMSYGM